MDLEVVVEKDGPSCWLALDWSLLVLSVSGVPRVESGCRWCEFSSIDTIPGMYEYSRTMPCITKYPTEYATPAFQVPRSRRDQLPLTAINDRAER